MNPEAPTAVLVFAKAPEPGHVKTRLAPALGDGGAAVLAARLLKGTLATVRAAALGPVTLCCAPDATHDVFRVFSRRFDVDLAGQGDGDLGARMHRALARTLETHETALLVGTDIPHMQTSDLNDAAERLRNGTDVVLGPAEDGGYWLIGARRVDARLFDGLAWGGPHVLADTSARVRSLGWSVSLVEMRRDVDRPDDVAWLAADPGSAPLVADLLEAAVRRRHSP